LPRIERANTYARSLALPVVSTIILGLRNLSGWAGGAFALVAVVTAVSALEPFSAWRDRWVLMEETHRGITKADSLNEES
jgi:hypothetical protein